MSYNRRKIKILRWLNMIMWEVKEALKELLEENKETIIITDTETCYAEDVAFQLEQLFKSLKRDYKITKIEPTSFEVTLYN
jgi:uncharacterized protein (UPF0216 family)